MHTVHRLENLMKSGRITAGLAALACLTTAVTAQPFTWTENAGWLNWNQTHGIDQGPQYQPDAFTGFAWGENIGWINLGNTPAPPATSMQAGDAFGVGIDPDGFLFGYAWAENAGWISFDLPQLDELRPRFHRGRLLGYAWAENFGWINLNDDEIFAQFACPADINGDGLINFFDISLFLSQFNAGSLRTDWNLDGSIDFFDVSGFIFDHAQGCTR